MKYILVLDVGTTNVKGLAYSMEGELIEDLERRASTSYPHPGWVEQDPAELMDVVGSIIEKMISLHGKPLGVGLTNQRSSTVLWDKRTGEPYYNMITWQDTRTVDLVNEFSSKPLVKFGRGLGKIVSGISKALPFIRKTGRGGYLATLSFTKFGTSHSSMHIRWIMDNIEGLKDKIERGEAAFGTIDSWIAWNLTGNHVTDYTNASATGLFDPFYKKWSENILKITGIPEEILPRLIPNDEKIGVIKGHEIPFLTMIADQQAALYMGGVSPGTVKMTNGTGTFVDMNVGKKPIGGGRGIFPMISLKSGDRVHYMLEGFVKSTGSAIDWLIKVGLMDDYSDISKACRDIERGCTLTFIPALSGLGSPYERPEIKGVLKDITSSTSREEIIRGMVTGIAMRCTEVIGSLESLSGKKVDKVLAEGGMSKSDDFLQLVSDLSGKKILRPTYLNGSAYGAYMMAKAVYKGKDPVEFWHQPKIGKIFTPRDRDYEDFKERWEKCIESNIEK